MAEDLKAIVACTNSMHQHMVQTLAKMAPQRPLFHSEADFQIALAVGLGLSDPAISIRAETVLVDEKGNQKLDLLLRRDSHEHGIELKLHKRAFLATIDGEPFRYPENNPRDVSRRNFLYDIHRLEDFVEQRQQRTGTAIILTNDPLMWEDGIRSGATDTAFCLAESKEMTGLLGWQDHTSECTKKRCRNSC